MVPRRSSSPTKEQLWEVYRSGIELSRYLPARLEFSDHTVAKIIAMSPLPYLEIAERCEAAIERGVTTEELSTVFNAGLDCFRYMALRLDYTKLITHKEAIEALQYDVASYSVIRWYGFSHEEIIIYAKEGVEVESFTNYFLGRNRGFSISEARLLGMSPTFPSDLLRKLLDDESITIDELVIAAGLDGSSLILNSRSSYVALRVRAKELGIDVSHAQACVVATNQNLGPYTYLEMRQANASHEKILASFVHKPKPQSTKSRKSKQGIITPKGDSL